MRQIHFLTHPDVAIDPTVAVTDWALSERGFERLRLGLASPCFQDIGTILCSTERKATDTVDVVGAHFDLPYRTDTALGENDRSSTGYLPRAEFEKVADQFFETPEQSVRGWARAADEQARIVNAARRIAATAKPNRTTLIVSHGAVGALLMADLMAESISRRLDQPANGGGNWFGFDGDAWDLLGGWRPID
ncbi:MAG: phosphoglycerate mutase family protein [Alphaproteobacteria bacterium]|nr:phosphoglycerate mutase family protein [Alphaproteobacteria bacterium]